MKLDNFTLEEYEEFNIEHKTTMVNLMNDPAVNRFIGNLDYFIEHTKVRRENNGIDSIYIVKKAGTSIGFISLNIFSDKYEMSIAILPEYRHQYLGTMLVTDFTDYLFRNNEDINEIYVEINPSNVNSIKMVDNSGFKKDNSTRYVIKRPIKKTL